MRGIAMSESIRVELELEEDGRWIGEAIDLPGVLAYGSTREEAKAGTIVLAQEVLLEQTEN
jgi:predicted RNase H-like HicB family nuclease